MGKKTRCIAIGIIALIFTAALLLLAIQYTHNSRLSESSSLSSKVDSLVAGISRTDWWGEYEKPHRQLNSPKPKPAAKEDAEPQPVRYSRPGVPLRQKQVERPKVAALSHICTVKNQAARHCPPVQPVATETKSRNTKGRDRNGPVLGCEQFQNFTWPKTPKQIAVVGNGPLTESSRREIEGMDLVIRFNRLYSYRCGEKFDVWASRHGDAVKTRYWGIGQKLSVSNCSQQKLLDLAKRIWLMNGGDGPFHHFLSSFPQIKEKGNYLWLDCRLWVTRYMKSFDPKYRAGLGFSSQDEVSPSSGWLVLMMVMDCAPPTTNVHLYGFNWPGGQWPAHKVTGEKQQILEMAAAGRLTLHETQCKHKYKCEPEPVARV